MSLTPIARNRLEMALRNNGYHIEHEIDGAWLAADATAAPGRCFVAYTDGSNDHALVATSLSAGRRSIRPRGGVVDRVRSLPIGAICSFSYRYRRLACYVRRIFELSRSLPTAPLDALKRKSVPFQWYEPDRLVIQRIGQDIFRDTLMDLWLKRCAVTGLDQPELLRASHMKPWADCLNNAERLNPYNGLLLAAHWDAAFDRGLVTFEDDGRSRLSEMLSEERAGFFFPTRPRPRASSSARRPSNIP